MGHIDEVGALPCEQEANVADLAVARTLEVRSDFGAVAPLAR